MIAQSLDSGPLQARPVIPTMGCILLQPRAQSRSSGLLDLTENDFVTLVLKQGFHQCFPIPHMQTVTFHNSDFLHFTC